jgi:nucleoid DNA-binding protein
MSLTIGQLVRLIASDTGFTKIKSSEMLKVLLHNLTQALAKGDSVKIRGFGKFYLKHQKRRKIRHPLTGKNFVVRAKRVVRFRCFESLHQEINYFYFDIDGFNRENEIILLQLYDLIENSGDYEEEEEMF